MNAIGRACPRNSRSGVAWRTRSPSRVGPGRAARPLLRRQRHGGTLLALPPAGEIPPGINPAFVQGLVAHGATVYGSKGINLAMLCCQVAANPFINPYLTSRPDPAGGPAWRPDLQLTPGGSGAFTRRPAPADPFMRARALPTLRNIFRLPAPAPARGCEFHLPGWPGGPVAVWPRRGVGAGFEAANGRAPLLHARFYFLWAKLKFF